MRVKVKVKRTWYRQARLCDIRLAKSCLRLAEGLIKRPFEIDYKGEVLKGGFSRASAIVHELAEARRNLGSGPIKSLSNATKLEWSLAAKELHETRERMLEIVADHTSLACTYMQVQVEDR